jgi:carbon storage regulator
MLVLSRKEGESILVGSDIRITVLRVKGSSVRVGIEAPSHTGILRSEIEFDTEAVSATVPGGGSLVGAWGTTP